MSHRQITLMLVLLLFSVTFLPACMVSASYQDPTIDISLAYTHDLHSHLYSEWTGTQCSDGMPLLSAKIQELRALRPLLLFDCGDTISGSPVNDINNGIPMIEVMNAIGYNAMALDNHDFDPGTSALKNMIDAADFDVLSANVDWPGSPKPLDYSIESVSGYDIGVIGLSTSFWYAPDDVTMEDQATAVNAAVVVLQDQGIDFIILLGCLSSSLASSVSGIDILIKGGSLETIGDTLVLPTIGSYASQVGVLDLTIDTSDGSIDSYTFQAHNLDSSLLPDENIVSIIDTWNNPLAATLDTAVGYFDSHKSIGDLGDMLSDAILNYADADVATYNHGGIRETIDEGFVTYRDIYRIEPFFNFVATVDLKGSDVVSVIASNYYASDISNFEPDTWYTVASSNFSVTYYERTYTSDAINRQDFISTSVVSVFADYVSTVNSVSRSDLLSTIDTCRLSLSSLPDSYLIGGFPSELRSQIDEQLLDARNALVAVDDSLAFDHLVAADDLVDSHINVSCPSRWFSTNINNIIDYLDLTSTSPSTSTNPSPLDFLWILVLVIIAVVSLLLVVYTKFLKRQKSIELVKKDTVLLFFS